MTNLADKKRDKIQWDVYKASLTPGHRNVQVLWLRPNSGGECIDSKELLEFSSAINTETSTPSSLVRILPSTCAVDPKSPDSEFPAVRACIIDLKTYSIGYLSGPLRNVRGRFESFAEIGNRTHQTRVYARPGYWNENLSDQQHGSTSLAARTATTMTRVVSPIKKKKIEKENCPTPSQLLHLSQNPATTP